MEVFHKTWKSHQKYARQTAEELQWGKPQVMHTEKTDFTELVLGNCEVFFKQNSI